MKSKIYIYLAKRNKKEIKMLGILNNPKTCYPTKIPIEEIKEINLPNEIINLIVDEFKKNKLIWEIYIESSESYENLKKSLIKRGYKNLPFQQISLNLSASNLSEKLFNKNIVMIGKNQSNKT